MTEGPLTLADLDAIGVARLKGVGPEREKGLAELGITTVLDLLWHYPRRWVDRGKEASVADLYPGEQALVIATVRRSESRRIKGRRSMVNVDVADDSGRLRISFFNQAWRAKQLPVGTTAAFFGKVEEYRGSPQMTNPLVDLIGDQTGRIVPIYPQSEKARITSQDVSRAVAESLRRAEPRSVLDPVPPAVLRRFGLVDRWTALQGIHTPEVMDDRARARDRLVFDELLRIQLLLVRRKRRIQQAGAGMEHDTAGPVVESFLSGLPYELTGAQARAIEAIRRDLAGAVPMQRLLQGDVGAGKTVVAVTTMLTAVEGRHQGVLLAPTEVLAEQHLASIRELVEGIEVPDATRLGGTRPLKVSLLTGRLPAAERREVLNGLVAGEVDIVVGTQALLSEGVTFCSLGVVVVDEQHRFGVDQRDLLRQRVRDQGRAEPDLLVMTATPIPRTAAMTVYGDLDVTVLDELPPGRQPIETAWAQGPLEEEQVWGSVRAEIADGRQAYVVCPLIDEGASESKAAEQVHAELESGELAGLRLGLLHGRQPGRDKELTMDAFRRGDLDVLVSTTVIEVGVDVPNATVMVILDAGRFGMAQLHQLRGRVGRGAHASYCHLVGEAATPDAEARLQALEASTDGFELAEKDLELRGEGTLMSTRQSGRNDLRLASLRRDTTWVVRARDAAEELVGDDPDLGPHPELRAELEHLFPPETEIDEALARG
ncbi:MAG: ATP-dependent DNA helicase RecG [Actinomycetota bacterium]